jgi:hypothetical protein
LESAAAIDLTARQDRGDGGTVRLVRREISVHGRSHGVLQGRYPVDAGVRVTNLTDRVEGAAFLDVEDGAIAGRPATRQPGSGNVSLPHCWEAPA